MTKPETNPKVAKWRQASTRKACVNKITYRKLEHANGVIKKLGHSIYQCMLSPFWRTTTKYMDA
jgi:hypothetical protein